MAQAQFDQSVTIAAPPERILALIAAISELGTYHPLIVGVVEDPPDTSAFGTPRRNYRVTDRLPVGPFRTRFTYRATVTTTPDGRLYTEAFQSPGVHLITWYECAATGEATRLMEHCTVQAARLLLGFVRRQAQAAHGVMLQQMQAHLEGDPESQ